MIKELETLFDKALDDFILELDETERYKILELEVTLRTAVIKAKDAGYYD